jgi:hypothetical protein
MAKSCDAHPAIAQIRERVMRSLGKSEAERYRNLILRNAEGDSNHNIDFGNYLDRIKSVASRTIKGLYFLERKRRIPSTHQVSVFVGNEYQAYGMENVKRFRSLFAPLLEADTKAIGDQETFLYVWAEAAGDDPHATVWYLEFFGGYLIFGYTLAPGDPRELASHFPPIHNMHLLPKLATIFLPSCGELSSWVGTQLGEIPPSRATKTQDLPPGVTPVLRGRLGKYKKGEL